VQEAREAKDPDSEDLCRRRIRRIAALGGLTALIKYLLACLPPRPAPSTIADQLTITRHIILWLTIWLMLWLTGWLA
jgi:hypothetical protein